MKNKHHVFRMSLFSSVLAIGLVAQAAHAVTIEYTYDALGRLTYVTDPANGDVNYDYDKAGNRTLVEIPTGSSSGSSSGGPPNCRAMISNPAYSCAADRHWSYGEYQYCTSMENSYGCVWQ